MSRPADPVRRRPLYRRVPANYWPYMLLAGAFFAAGGVAGALLVDIVELGEAVGARRSVGGPVQEPTVGFLIVNNAIVLVLLVASGLTLGLGTVAILVFNGAIVGYVAVLAARVGGPFAPVVGLLPHGVIEVPAMLLASAVAFRFSHQVLRAATRRRAEVMTRAERREATAATAVSLALVPVAAYVEVNVTVAVLEAYL